MDRFLLQSCASLSRYLACFLATIAYSWQYAQLIWFKLKLPEVVEIQAVFGSSLSLILK